MSRILEHDAEVRVGADARILGPCDTRFRRHRHQAARHQLDDFGVRRGGRGVTGAQRKAGRAEQDATAYQCMF
ncbi:MAG: hypothetical protein WDN04_19815 [Rhodospirillales bacterium]